jgi:GNAT superfamily N-acetyltransferase
MHRSALESHFLALDRHDRRLRFGVAHADEAVRAYVARIDLVQDAAFGVFSDDLHLSGAAHVARAGGYAEVGLSVLSGERGRGIGGQLLARAHTHARNWGVRALFVYCLAENAAMMHLARQQNMDVVIESGDAAAWLKLPPADAASHVGAAFDQYVALFDHALKTRLSNVRRFAGALRVKMDSPGCDE